MLLTAATRPSTWTGSSATISTLRLGFSYALSDHDTDTAAGGVEALSKLENESYDLVILDLMLPDCEGLGSNDHLLGYGLSP